MGTVKRASALIPNMGPVAREVCVASGSDWNTDQGGLLRTVQLLNDYVSPGAADSVYQEVALSMQFKRTARTTDGCSVSIDLSCRKAESNLQRKGLLACLRLPA